MKNPEAVNFLITMYNEFNVVQSSVLNIRNSFENAKIFIVQSDDGTGRAISGSDGFVVLSNLAPEIRPHKLAAHAISRNYGRLFSDMYSRNTACDLVVAMTGDTLLADPTMVLRIRKDMDAKGKVLACSQAIGQNFHAPDSDPEHGICGGRMQFDGISDFMPQFFVVDGKFAFEKKVFGFIPIVNEFTSEQCLGNEFMTHVRGSFLDNALVIARNAYEYSDGILYQVR